MLSVILILVAIALLALLLRQRVRFGVYFVLAALPFERIGSFDIFIGSTDVTVRPSQLVGAALILLGMASWTTFRPRHFEWLPGLYLLAGVASVANALDPLRCAFVLIFSAFVWGLFVAIRHFAAHVDWTIAQSILWWACLV